LWADRFTVFAIEVTAPCWATRSCRPDVDGLAENRR
jgi:hypothetical protein